MVQAIKGVDTPSNTKILFYIFEEQTLRLKDLTISKKNTDYILKQMKLSSVELQLGD